MRINELNYRRLVLCNERENEREAQKNIANMKEGTISVSNEERSHIRQRSEGLCEGKERYYGKEKEKRAEGTRRRIGH